jgi:hypothetical protein
MQGKVAQGALARGRNDMIRHGPDCLEGPTSHSSSRWTRTTPAENPIRFELVQRIRREIAAGVYETPEKWDAAVAELFRRLEHEKP